MKKWLWNDVTINCCSRLACSSIVCRLLHLLVDNTIADYVRLALVARVFVVPFSSYRQHQRHRHPNAHVVAMAAVANGHIVGFIPAFMIFGTFIWIIRFSLITQYYNKNWYLNLISVLHQYIFDILSQIKNRKAEINSNEAIFYSCFNICM